MNGTKNICKVTGLVFLALALTSPLLAQDQVMFNYQGYIQVLGVPYHGTGLFKFAIVSTSSESTLWSNDGTSAAGSEPFTSLNIPVNNGVFQVMIGDPSAGMSSINRIIFNETDIQLRVWFSDGTHGFEQLTPDTKLHNLDLLGVKTDTSDFTIYVSGATGNDTNDGLTTATAKKTISGAVNVLPTRIRCNVTVDVADGVYREQVMIFGITADEGKYVTFLGDENWTPGSVDPPSVRVTGTDLDTTSTSPVSERNYGFIVRHSSGICIQGFLVDYAADSGIYVAESNTLVKNCQASYNRHTGGIVFTTAGYGLVQDCMSDHNTRYGFVTANYSGPITNGTIIARYNGVAGFYVVAGGRVSFHGTADLSNNTLYGVVVNGNAQIYFGYGDYTGTINNNGVYGLVVQFDSNTLNHDNNTFSGNGTQAVYTDTGGHAYTTGGVSGL